MKVIPFPTGNRRHDRRVDARVLVEYERLEEFLLDYTANLSVGGLFIRTDQPLEVGTRFRLRFKLPGTEHTVQTWGVVTWASPVGEADERGGMGVRFDEFDPGDRRLIEHLLEELGEPER